MTSDSRTSTEPRRDPTATSAGLRARVRAELLAEIKVQARRQLDEHGPQALSLRAIARELGMVSSAIYRYVPSRDDLLTALIIDAYEALGEAAERADAELADRRPRSRWRAACQAAYDWAREHRAEYALIYGTPVPGYEAPPDTVVPAQRFTTVLTNILADLPAPPADGRALRFHGAARADLVALAQLMAPGSRVDPEQLGRGVHAWIGLVGTISFLVFGHLDAIVADRDAFFAAAVELLADEVMGPD